MQHQKAKVLVSASSKATGYDLPIIQQGDSILISAQLLHKKLKSGYQFADWIKRRLNEYGFIENQDYFSEKSEKLTSGRKATDYLLTIDTAKELAMLEKNEVGRSIRRYFIAKEKELRSISHLPKDTQLFRGLKPKRINDRLMYPYSDIRERAGYKRHGGGTAKTRYWMHFIKDGNINYVTAEFALHMLHSKQVYNNRKVMQAMQPVLPLNFGSPLNLQA